MTNVKMAPTAFVPASAYSPCTVLVLPFGETRVSRHEHERFAAGGKAVSTFPTTRCNDVHADRIRDERPWMPEKPLVLRH